MVLLEQFGSEVEPLVVVPRRNGAVDSLGVIERSLMQRTSIVFSQIKTLLLGHLYKAGISGLWNSELARRSRAMSSATASCRASNESGLRPSEPKSRRHWRRYMCLAGTRL